MGTNRSETFFKDLISKLPDVLVALEGLGSKCGYPVYSSMDIRDAGWKICSVDVNIFPAGFNLLSESDRERGALVMQHFLSTKLKTPGPWKVTVVPEAHTNNMGYLDNLAGILSLLEKAGVVPRLAWSGPPIPKAWIIKTPSGRDLHYLPALEALEGADAILLNHDMSGGLPKFLEGNKLPIFPSPALGWYRRRKSQHFDIVASLLQSLAKKFEFFDPWYFETLTSTLKGVNVEDQKDRERLSDEATRMIKILKEQYLARGINEEPALFIKNDAGTYGMGVLQIRHPEEILAWDRSDKNKMRKGKESVPISDFILQEAIPTALTYLRDGNEPDSRIAGESVLYMIDGTPIGGFLRLHEKLGAEAQWKNLNQPGGHLEHLGSVAEDCSARPFPKIRGLCPREEIEGRYLYHFLAKLHATAAGLEECQPA